MVQSLVIIKDWPFKDEEKAILMRISKPYLKDGLWLIDALFYSESSRQLREIHRNLGDLLTLHINGIYENGKFIGYPSGVEKDIEIPSSVISHRNIEPYLNQDKKNSVYDYYTFGIPYKNHFYIIPLIELVRAVLAPDVFWMNLLVQFDMQDLSFVSTRENDVLYLDFDVDVPLTTVKHDDKINHIAWVMTNPNIISMISKIYKNIVANKGFLFDFQFSSLNMRAVVDEIDKKIFVKEIKILRQKRINTKGIEVSHPLLYQYTYDEETKEQLKRTISVKKGGERLLIGGKTGSLKDRDILDKHISKSEYIGYVKIKRKHHVKHLKQPVETENTERKYRFIDTARTTADIGGIETVPQLEFDNDLSYTYEGVFDEINSIIDLISERSEIKEVFKHVGLLEQHRHYGLFTRLSDGQTKRKYFIGKIISANGKEAILMEIEREERSIATLMLVSNISVNWNIICHKVLRGMIKKTGTWPDEILTENKNKYSLQEYRFYHTVADIRKKEKKIFMSIG